MNGIVLINKEKEYTSHDVVAIVKRITKSKVGHTGTLDPNATGVLPLLLGDATKICKYLINHDKTYEVVLELGTKTTTADSEGDIVEQREVPIKIFEDINYVEEILNTFLGKSMQTPPIYSAIKVNGKKLYDYARQGKKIEIEPRQIEIYSIKLNRINEKTKQIYFTVECSKGTYIRSLCEDIAEKLHTVGFMKELNRVKVGEFCIEDSLKINEFEQRIEKKDLSCIISIEKMFINYPCINLPKEYIKAYTNGVSVNTKTFEAKDCIDGVYKVYENKKFIGLGVIKDGKLKRDLFLG